jgi:hypothetical protein
MTDPDAPGKPGEHKSLSIAQVFMSTVAAAFGVQSSANRERDFTRGKASQFIVMGIIFTVLFVFAVVMVVRLVLSNAGV